MTASADVGIVDNRYPELVWVSGGMPILSENEAQVSLVFPVGSAGQQPPPSDAVTLPNAATSSHPVQLDWQEIVSYEIFQTPKSV